MDLETGPWKTDSYWVSHYQFLPEVRDQLQLPPKVEFHDSTLRDGEQSPGVVFSVAQKVEIARMLDAAGFQYIEAGFPPVSKADRDAISEIVGLGLKAKITCLARARAEDIQMAVDCGVWGAILEVPGSLVRLKYQFGWTEDEVIKKTVFATVLAKEKGLAAIPFIMDSARADLPFLIRLINTVEREASADRVALVDTSGCATPRGWYYLVSKVRQSTDLPIEVHCHNDFGMGVANTVIALASGAEVVHATVTGIGERAGNAAMEDVALSLLTLYGIDIGLKYEKIYELSKLVRELSGLEIPSNRPIVGDMLFNVESGIIASWVKNSGPEHIEEVFPFHWDLVGQKPVEIVLGKNSGIDTINMWLDRIGAKASEEQANAILMEVKALSLQKKRLLDEDEFRKIVSGVVGS